MSILDFKSFIDKLNEGLIKTYNLDKTISSIEKELMIFSNLEFKVNKNDNNTFSITILNLNKIHVTEIEGQLEFIMNRLLNTFGWFPSFYTYINSFNGTNGRNKFTLDDIISKYKNISEITIFFESKFDIQSEIPEVLYHISIASFKKSILESGLSPKSKSKLTSHDYDGRIYVCSTINSCLQLIPSMKMFYQDEEFNIRYKKTNPNKKYLKQIKWVLYKIDMRGLSTKLYKDPNYENGYYILENIPKDRIKIIEEEA